MFISSNYGYRAMHGAVRSSHPGAGNPAAGFAAAPAAAVAAKTILAAPTRGAWKTRKLKHYGRVCL